jgi:Transposase DDE domain
MTIHTKFSRTDCAKCSVNNLCTKHGEKNPRKLSLLPREEHELLIATRKQQRTPEWKKMYNKRAGIEGTFSQGVRSAGLRRSRYRGLSKTHLQNVAIACAMTLGPSSRALKDFNPRLSRRKSQTRAESWRVLGMRNGRRKNPSPGSATELKRSGKPQWGR